jgi:predicted Zn-dependent protease
VFHIRLIILLFLGAFSLQSCAFHPAIDENGHVTSRKANKIVQYHSALIFERIKKKRSISHDPRYTEPVERVSTRLKQVIEMPDAQWEFVIFKDRTPNAFALSGGKVGINTGLFKIADTDALLAAVLGHEISHATANHSEQRFYRAIGTVALGALLWSAMEKHDGDHAGYAVAGYALAAYLMDSLPLARRQEYESDRIGAIYMAQAGYDPTQAIKLWKKLESYHSEKNKKLKPEYLRTHPHDSSRIQALEDFMPVALKHYKTQGSHSSK